MGAYLAGRRRKGAALGLGESVPGSEHDGCDGVRATMDGLDNADGSRAAARERDLR